MSKVAYLTLCGGSMTGEGQQRHGTERPVGTDPQLIGTVWISAPHGQAGRPGSASEAQVLLRPTTPPRGPPGPRTGVPARVATGATCHQERDRDASRLHTRRELPDRTTPARSLRLERYGTHQEGKIIGGEFIPPGHRHPTTAATGLPGVAADHHCGHSEVPIQTRAASRPRPPDTSSPVAVVPRRSHGVPGSPLAGRRNWRWQ